MKLKRTLFIVMASVLFGAGAFAQENTHNWATTDNATLFTSFKNYMKTLQVDVVGEPFYYMTQELLVECEATFKNGAPYAWLGQVSRFCNFAESIYGPAMSHPRTGTADKYAKVRKAIFMMRDFPMHEMSIDEAIAYPAEQRTAFLSMNNQWLNEKREEFFQFLDSPRPTGNELQIMKVYSSGVVLRTKNGCIGIDICYNEAFGTTAGIEKLSDALDVLYVTHAHGDHYDKTLIRSMVNKKKPVVMTDNIASTNSGYELIWNSTHTPHTRLGGVAETAAIMSAQGTTPCLLYHIEMDGWRIIHVGDNSIHSNETQLAKMDQADLVISPVFQGLTTLFSNIRGAANPDKAQQFYLNIHENEFHHVVNGRVSFKYMYTNSGALGSTSAQYPCTLLLDNGEHIILTK